MLLEARTGGRDALDRLFPLVYRELKAIAHRRLQAERADHTLNTTALVHESYLRLVDQTRVDWGDRGRFFSVAAMAMRRILVDYARRRLTEKRGGGRKAISLDSSELSVDDRAETLVALDQALENLAALDARLARVVECRFFGGLTEDETAGILGVTPRTVRRDWVKAKGFLSFELAAPEAL